MKTIKFTRGVMCTHRWAGEQRPPISWYMSSGEEIYGPNCQIIVAPHRTVNGLCTIYHRTECGNEVYEHVPVDSFELTESQDVC
jgi:hypothetical protein